MLNTVLLSGLFHGSIISHSMEQFAETTDPDVPTHGIFTYCNHHVSICHCGSEGQYHDITKKNHRLEKLEHFPSRKAKSEVDCNRSITAHRLRRDVRGFVRSVGHAVYFLFVNKKKS